MVWRAFIKGGKFDLDLLSAQFTEGAARVLTNSAEHWIEADEFAVLTSAEQVRAAADKILSRMNGVARLSQLDHEPVELQGRFDDGTGAHVVHLLDTVHMSERASIVASGEVRDAAGNLVPAPEPPSVAYLRLAQTDPDVEEVMQILSGSPPNWAELHKIMEIVENDVGGATQIKAKGWATSGELDSFGTSANHQSVSGPNARHARMKGTPRKQGMDIAAGREFIRRLATRWIDDKLSP